MNSEKESVQLALMEISWYWRKHPEVKQLQLSLAFRSLERAINPVNVSGTRGDREIRWAATSPRPFQYKMFWMGPKEVSLSVLQTILKAESWGTQDNDGLYASTTHRCYWKSRGNLQEYLRQAARPSEREFELQLFQGGDLDSATRPLQPRGKLEALALYLLWDAQAGWYQRCQDGVWLDLEYLGKKRKYSRFPWEEMPS